MELKDFMEFKDSQVAFQMAIERKHFTANKDDSNFAGNFMYMGEAAIEGKRTIYFKNIDSREYKNFVIEDK